MFEVGRWEVLVGGVCREMVCSVGRQKGYCSLAMTAQIEFTMISTTCKQRLQLLVKQLNDRETMNS